MYKSNPSPFKGCFQHTCRDLFHSSSCCKPLCCQCLVNQVLKPSHNIINVLRFCLSPYSGQCAITLLFSRCMFGWVVLSSHHSICWPLIFYKGQIATVSVSMYRKLDSFHQTLSWVQLFPSLQVWLIPSSAISHTKFFVSCIHIKWPNVIFPVNVRAIAMDVIVNINTNVGT